MCWLLVSLVVYCCCYSKKLKKNTFSICNQIVGFFFGAIPWLKNLIIGDSAPLKVIQDSIKLLGYVRFLFYLWERYVPRKKHLKIICVVLIRISYVWTTSRTYLIHIFHSSYTSPGICFNLDPHIPFVVNFYIVNYYSLLKCFTKPWSVNILNKLQHFKQCKWLLCDVSIPHLKFQFLVADWITNCAAKGQYLASPLY